MSALLIVQPVGEWERVDGVMDYGTAQYPPKFMRGLFNLTVDTKHSKSFDE